MPTLIKDVLESALSATDPVSMQLSKIAALGYRTVEQFAGAARAAQPAFEYYLKASVDELLDVLQPESLYEAELELIRATEYGLGAEIGNIPAVPLFAPGIFFSESELPDTIDMTSEMPEIRNQNPRGTCIAHAALAVFEHFLRQQGNQWDLSEQFLTFVCKENDGLPYLEGSLLAVAFSRLLIDGCCHEETWPYNNKSNPCNWGQGPPPDNAPIQALTLTIPGIAQLPARDINALKTVLASRRSIAFSIPAYRSWFCSEEVKLSGNILMPPPTDVSVGGHAMCLVGYRDMLNASDLGGGVFLIRNSWGDRWGITSAVKGYGTVPYRFISSFCLEAYAIDT